MTNWNRTTFGVLTSAALALAIAGCSSSRYEPEPVAAPAAPAASPAAAPAAGTAAATPANTVTGVVEWARAWYGKKGSQGSGTMTLNGDVLEWRNQEDFERSFSLRAGAIERVWLTCAARSGQNLCLDLGLTTLTGLEFHFRDVNWAGGENASILRIYEFIRQNVKTARFEEKVIEKVD